MLRVGFAVQDVVDSICCAGCEAKGDKGDTGDAGALSTYQLDDEATTGSDGTFELTLFCEDSDPAPIAMTGGYAYTDPSVQILSSWWQGDGWQVTGTATAGVIIEVQVVCIGEIT